MRANKFITASFALAICWASPAHSQEKTFGGYDCTEDCSGHAAGYKWAEEKDIQDESDCGGDSQSFIEGCETYVQDPNRGATEDDEGNDIEN
jgi:hypothetical protein